MNEIDTEDVYVHSHALRHGLTEGEILQAWENYVSKQRRESPNESETVAVGFTDSGRDVQMVGITKGFGVLIVHALHPVTEKVLRELGLEERRKNGRKDRRGA